MLETEKDSWLKGTYLEYFCPLGEKDQPLTEKAGLLTLGDAKRGISCPITYDAPFLALSSFSHPLIILECEFHVSRGFVCLVHC